MTTPAYNAPGYFPPVPYRSWFARNWKWFVPVLVATFVAMLGLFLLGLFVTATGMIRSSGAYKTAIQKAEQNPVVETKIGRPFRVGKFVQGNVNFSGDSGDAELSIPITGERGSGHIIARAKKRAGEWTFQTLEVHVDSDGTVIPLLGAGGGESAPADDSV
jgi:hypothetical protein